MQLRDCPTKSGQVHFSVLIVDHRGQVMDGQAFELDLRGGQCSGQAVRSRVGNLPKRNSEFRLDGACGSLLFWAGLGIVANVLG